VIPQGERVGSAEISPDGGRVLTPSMDGRVRQLGGEVDVISTLGKGSEIDVRLPLTS